MKLRGTVTRKLLYSGTKSEHEGLVILASQGQFNLRRQGGNPFHDETLDQLEGKEIEGEGILRGDQFILSAWKILQ